MSSSNWQREKQELGKRFLKGLLEVGLLRTWYRDNPNGWEWISGLRAPIYINLRPLTSYPDLFNLASDGMGKTLIREADYDKPKHVTLGVDYAGRPLSAGITLLHGIPSLGTRRMPNVRTVEDFEKEIAKASSSYGEHSLVEGEVYSGDTVALVDDVTTFLDAKRVSLRQFEHFLSTKNIKNVRYDDMCIAIDYGFEESAELARKLGLTIYSLLSFRGQGLDFLKDDLTSVEFKVLSDFLENPRRYQDPEQQRYLKQLADKNNL